MITLHAKPPVTVKIFAVAIVLTAYATTRAETKAPQPLLRAGDLIALEERFGEFREGLPDCAQLNVDEILAYEENRLFVSVAGRTESLTRRILFLKPSTFVVDDTVAGATDEPVRWFLQAERMPEGDGRQLRLAHGYRALAWNILLPKDVVAKAAKKPRQSHTESQPPQRTLELIPTVNNGPVRFLHVFHLSGTGEDRSAAETKLVEKDGNWQLTVSTGGRTFEVMLPTSGKRSGTIAVMSTNGKTLVERRPLPAGILPHGTSGVGLLERWDKAYHGGRRAPWDIGRPATDLKKAVEDGTLRPCRAVVLGCGTGTNAIYLAGKGFDVTGIDIAPTALARAEQKAHKAKVQIRWVLADVLKPPQDLKPFDLIFDRGCYHGVRRSNAKGYVATARRLSHPGTQILLLAGNANEERHYGPPRVKEEELRSDFSALFDFKWLRTTHFDTTDPKQDGALAWSVLLERKGD